MTSDQRLPGARMGLMLGLATIVCSLSGGAIGMLQGNVELGLGFGTALGLLTGIILGLLL